MSHQIAKMNSEQIEALLLRASLQSRFNQTDETSKHVEGLANEDFQDNDSDFGDFDEDDKSGLDCSRWEAIKAATAHLYATEQQENTARSPAPSQLCISQATLHGGLLRMRQLKRNAPIRQTVELPTTAISNSKEDDLTKRYRQALRKQMIKLRQQAQKVAELEAKNAELEE